MTRTRDAINADLRQCVEIWTEYAQWLRTAGEEEKALSAEATARKFEARIVETKQ